MPSVRKIRLVRRPVCRCISSSSASVEMGKDVKRALKKGETMRIATGGMLPPGADSMVMVEYTEEMGDGTIEVQRSASPWENILRIGEDIKKGAADFLGGAAAARARSRCSDRSGRDQSAGASSPQSRADLNW